MSTEEEWWVKEYAPDIHSYLRLKERKRHFFTAKSPQLHMRKSMVEWMDAVCEKMNFCTTVQHLAVYLLDIFMDNHTINCDHLQLVTLGCLIVAVKLEESDCLIPNNTEFSALIGKKYKLVEYLQMEVSILTFFKWNISFPTAAHFAEYYVLYALQPTDNHEDQPLTVFERVKMYFQKYMDYFLEVTIQDHVFLKFYPSLVAASCVASTRMCLVLTPPWPVLLQNITYYKYAQLRPCVDLLMRALDADTLTNEKSCESKFSSTSCMKIDDCESAEDSDCMILP